MNNEELKKALYSECPVVVGPDGINLMTQTIYNKVTAIIYRKGSGKRPVIFAEVLDKSGNSVLIVSAEKISTLEVSK